MRFLNVPITLGKDENGKPITQMQQEKIYNINELSYLGKLLKCKDSKKRGISYLEIPCAFDIETTNVQEPLGDKDFFYEEDIYNDIKSLHIRYNDIIKNDIPDFEMLRRKYFGKLKLSKSKGTPVDSLYIELSDERPDLFPPSIENASDQLLQIIKVFEDNAPDKEKFRPYAFMYQWQFCFDNEVCFGRTWEEFVTLLSCLEKNLNLSLKNRLVIWVHNLGFEWQFMRNFLEYEEGFFLEERKPAKIITKGGIEFRCSYVLSNMSLSKFCENEKGVIHYKLEGEKYNYELLRTPFTPLSEYEEGYCYNDVRGLCECIKSRLESDTLGTIPLTSTGYVRRELRANVNKNKKNRQYFLNSKLDAHLYTLCREAFRGGDTHANSERAGQVNTDVWSFDEKSAYPAVMLEFDGFPFSAFARMDVSTYLNRDLSDYALLLKIAFKNIRYDTKGKNFCGMPYIALAKCNYFSPKKVIDNGRVLYAEFIELTVTNLDLELIKGEYVWEDMKIGEIWASKASKLSQEIRDTTMDYFRAKTLLDGNPDKVYEYMKSKNRLNSIFGCSVMRIDQSMITWDPVKKVYVDNTPGLEEALEKFYKSRNSFLQYQQGLFITAAARYRLRKMLWKVGRDAIYCDTDSIKGVGDHFKDFEEENIKIRKLAEDCGAYAEDKNQNVYYLGVWENETEGGLYDEFKTLGAKKYVYRQGDKVKSTIAGVSKKAGSEYFKKHGVDGLKKGAVIENSGHLTAFYNDDEIHQITVDHHTFTTSSNVALVNNTYKIGITEDYVDLLLKGIENSIDML